MRDKLRFHPLDFASAFGFIVYSASATVTPACLVILSRELNFSLFQGGLIELVRGILIIFILLFSAFIAEWLGKARALGLACLVVGVGFLGYAVSPNFYVVLLFVVLLGLGGGVVEALINPLVEELHPKDSGRYLNIANGFWSVGVLLAVLVASELLTQEVSWRLIFVGVSVSSFVAGVLFLWLRRTGGPRQRQSMAGVLREKTAILSSKSFWIFTGLMTCAGAIEGAFFFWSATLVQVQFDGSPRMGGYALALFALGMMLARFLWGIVIPQSQLPGLICWSAVGTLVLGITFVFVQSIGGIFVLLFLHGVAVACFWPSLQSYAVSRMNFSATPVFILLSCGGIAGFALASWVLGLVGEVVGLRESLILVPVFAALLLLFFGWERRQPQPR
jgi:fucose permease